MRACWPAIVAAACALAPLIAVAGEPNANFIHRKPAFWVANARGEVTVKPGVTVYAAVNNIFDINQHPIFIALDQTPCLANPTFQNGACGNSMPGREFVVGLQGRW